MPDEKHIRDANETKPPRHVVLMQEALLHGWTTQKVAQALVARIQRDERYLAYRRRSGHHTATDDAIFADLFALAWAACYLEEGIRDLGGTALPPSERGTMPSERGRQP